jgi:pimeloyl-ACP methyl ester carboxylesterase
MKRKSWSRRLSSLFAVIMFLGLSEAVTCSPLTATAEHLFIPHPDNSAKRVEYFLQKPQGHGPWPTIVFLQGWQPPPSPGGKVFAEWGVLNKYAAEGYLAISISLPGYGNSSGPPDFAGPFTVNAIIGVLSKLQEGGLAAPHRIVIEGISLGGMVAGLVGARDHSVSGLVMISGAYDLNQYVEKPMSHEAKLVINEIDQETGGGRAALRERSVLDYAQDIKAVALIMNGAKDDRTEPSQARELAGAINRDGGSARVIIYPNYGHHISVKVRNEIVDPFIHCVMGGGRGACTAIKNAKTGSAHLRSSGPRFFSRVHIEELQAAEPAICGTDREMKVKLSEELSGGSLFGGAALEDFDINVYQRHGGGRDARNAESLAERYGADLGEFFHDFTRES